jgi:hypothetical protein
MVTWRSSSGSFCYQAGQDQLILWLRLGSGGHKVAKVRVSVHAGWLAQRYLPAASHRGQRLQNLLLTQLKMVG